MKIIKSKKGISPTIATVLLVAFIIIIGILIWLWWGNIIKETAEKIGTQSQGQFACSNEVEFTVISLNCQSNDLNQADIEVENKGNTQIDNFRAIMQDDAGQVSVREALDEFVQVGASKQIVMIHNQSSPVELTLIPMVNRDGFAVACNEKQIVTSC